MTTLTLLTIILFILMIAVGRKNGLKAFLSIFVNICLLSLAIIFISIKINIVVTIFLFIIIMGAFNILITNGFNRESHVALLSTFLTFVVLLPLIYFAIHYTHIEGFAMEEGDDIATYSLNIGLSFVQITAFMIMISVLGAIIDISVSIATSMQEIFKHNPNMTSFQLFKSGMFVARDILGTTTNTLYFAYLGSYMTLLIWFFNLHYSFEMILNTKVFAEEVITILTGGIAVCIAIPLTCIIASRLITRAQ
ncbi:YibE/F family protein [Macrococcus sp. DPC7161]|uniref:YibE/F family protein n=1 Tax=Macrococcus sp. DPC7161 TaxID=2507060 RepID=UPI0013E8F6E6|nr:YibE/F family protein [Macrococcus sp. DPC7161]